MARSSHMDRLSPPLILSALFRAPFFQQSLLQAKCSLGQSYSRELLPAQVPNWEGCDCLLDSHSLAPAGLFLLPTSSLCLFGECDLCVTTARVCPARILEGPTAPTASAAPCTPLLWHTGGAMGCMVVLGSN